MLRGRVGGVQGEKSSWNLAREFIRKSINHSSIKAKQEEKRKGTHL